MSKKNKDPWYRQCTYTKPLPGGGVKQGVSWIPADLAKVDKPIYFGKKDDPDREMWTVIEVHDKQRESVLLAQRKVYKFQRGMSDI